MKSQERDKGDWRGQEAELPEAVGTWPAPMFTEPSTVRDLMVQFQSLPCRPSYFPPSSSSSHFTSLSGIPLGISGQEARKGKYRQLLSPFHLPASLDKVQAVEEMEM